MLTKTYGIKGVATFSYLFKLGNATLRATFDNGCVDPKRSRPATLTTSNRAAQLIIEHQPEFMNKTIFLVSAYDDGIGTPVYHKSEPKGKGKKSQVTTKTAETLVSVDAETGNNVYPEVTEISDAVNVLLSLGAAASSLTGNDAVINTALSMNVVFPNLKF